MSIITSTHDIRIAVPSTIDNAQAVEAWVTAMSDASWRVITDFRNWPNWMPQMDSAKQEDSGPPARGTRLIIERRGSVSVCTIDCWDPPRSLQISMSLGAGEVAYGFLIETGVRQGEIRLSLELERSLVGLSRVAPFICRWRLRRLGGKILANLAPRTRAAIGLQQ